MGILQRSIASINYCREISGGTLPTGGYQYSDIPDSKWKMMRLDAQCHAEAQAKLKEQDGNKL